MPKLSYGAASITATLIAVLAYFIGCNHLSFSKTVCPANITPPIAQLFGYCSKTFGSSAPSNRARFEQAFLAVRQGLVDSFAAQGVPEEAQFWYTRSIDYNVPGGKLNRGLSVVDSVEIMKGRPLAEHEFMQAAVLGWAVEFLQAAFLVWDDLMDKSITRRGQPCYYRVPDVGTISVNDGVLLQSAIFQLLKMYFRKETYYIDLMEIFHETTFQTSTGQLLDLITAPEDSVDLSKFSLEKFNLVALYKTAHYSFYLPVALAMLMCEIPATYHSRTSGKTEHPYTLARSILLPIGEYFQVQDDFLDFAGTPEQIGKIGTDIVDNKCSWCINTALAAASQEQRSILEENYGRREAGREARVKTVFEDLGLREKYQAYEYRTYTKILRLIEEVPEDEGVALKRQVFTGFLDKIYRRQK